MIQQLNSVLAGQSRGCNLPFAIAMATFQLQVNRETLSPHSIPTSISISLWSGESMILYIYIYMLYSNAIIVGEYLLYSTLYRT